MSDKRSPAELIAGLKKLVDRLGVAVAVVTNGIEDEGGRVYLGNTNHADELREAKDLYDEWRILDALPGVGICRHGMTANGSCSQCHRESESEDDQ